MVSQRVLRDLHQVSERLTRTQSKIASNKEIERPSDDPFGTSRAMVLRENLEGVKQFQRNVEDARGWQDATESALDRMTDVVQRARVLLVQGASDTMDDTARASIAREVDELAASIKEFGNASYKGQYLFGGIRTDVPPYTPAAVMPTAGRWGPIAGRSAPACPWPSTPTSRASSGQGPDAADDGLLHVLRDVAAHLRSEDGDSLRGRDLSRLDTKLEQLLDARALNGARSNRLDSALGRLTELEEASMAQLSETEDVDIAKAMIDFSSQQAAYQAALRASANIVQSSLMDFLR
jgi:flagellar hook-associated protein 3 FlgL